MPGPWEQYASAANNSGPWADFEGGDLDDGSRQLPGGVVASTAGGGRGSVNPAAPPESQDLSRPSRAQRIAEMDEVTDPTNPNYMPVTENAQAALQAAGRGQMDDKRTRSPGRVTDKDIPGMTPGSVARDAAAGVMQIVPTALKGVGDLARLATGDTVGKGLSEFAEETNKAVQQRVGSYSQYDLYLAYTGVDKLTVYAKVQNLADKTPPYDASFPGIRAPYDFSQYDLRGRYFTLGFDYRF